MTWDYGEREYYEDPSLFQERLKLSAISLSGLSLTLLIIYAGFLISVPMGLFTLALFGYLIYPTSMGLGTALFGIQNTEIRERGFFPPYCPPPIRLKFRKGFIPWSDVVDIVANKHLRATGLFPYIVVELKNTYFAIPPSYLKNPDFFIGHAERHTKIVRDREMKTGLHIVHFFPPPLSASIEDDGVVLHYENREERIDFEEIKRVKLRGGYQFLTGKGQRIAMFGLSEQDMLDIREAFRAYAGKRKRKVARLSGKGGLSTQGKGVDDAIGGGLSSSGEEKGG